MTLTRIKDNIGRRVFPDTGEILERNILHSQCNENYNVQTDAYRQHSIEVWGYD